MDKMKYLIWSVVLFALSTVAVPAGEADIVVPDLGQVNFKVFGSNLSGKTILYVGLGVCALGALFGLMQYGQTKRLQVHRAMAEVSNIIWETCKTYVLQQGKFLMVLWALIAVCMIYYFKILQHYEVGRLLVILL